MQEVITGYANASHLKKMIILRYVNWIKEEIKTYKDILDDANWASDGTDYHNQCRIDTQNKINELTHHISILK